MRFLIKEIHKDIVLEWLNTNVGIMGNRTYKWFPHYRTQDSKPAIMIHIGAREDCTAFVLNNMDYIVIKAE